MKPKRTLPPSIYYLLVSLLINLTFLAVGTLAFAALPGPLEPDPTLALIVLGVLLIKAAVVSVVTGTLHKGGRLDRTTGATFVGYYYARFFGTAIGAFLGMEIGADINAATGAKFGPEAGLAIGAVTLFLAGRWIGPRLGRFLGRLVDRGFSLPESLLPARKVPSPSQKLFIGLYGGLCPLLFVLLALFFEWNDIQVSGLLPGEWLPAARAVVLVVSLLSVLAPWLLRAQVTKAYTEKGLAADFGVFWIGIVFSVVPVIYGFLLFVMGAPFAELFLLAAACSAAAVIWSLINNPQRKTAA